VASNTADEAGGDGVADSPTIARSGPGSTPPSGLTTALPSGLARGLAFVAILIGGACGGLIGYAFADLSCTGECDTWLGVGALAGAIIAAVGVAVVAILALRAMEEWETVRARDTSQP